MAGGGITLGFLKFVLGLDSLSFDTGLDDAAKKLKQSQKKMEKIATSMVGVGQKLTLGITAPLTAFAIKGVKEARETADAMGQVNAALKSMGNASGRTADQLTSFADKMELSSLYEGDQILRKVTANMLTFGNISGEVFDRAQQSAVDLATRMNIDLKAATILVGKALNDPVKGMGALGKAGIQFSKDQKKMIQSLIDTGQAAKAQDIILKELERQFRGSAQAAQDTDPWNKATDAFNQMAEKVGTALLPMIERVSEVVVDLAESFAKLSPETQKWIFIAAAGAAAVGPLLIAIGTMVSGIGALLPLLVKAGPAGTAATTGLLPLVAAVGAVYLAWKNWDTIGPMLEKLTGTQNNYFDETSKRLSDFSTEWDQGAKDVQAWAAEVDKQLGTEPPQVKLDALGVQIQEFAAAWNKGAKELQGHLATIDKGLYDFAIAVENTMLRANKAIRGMVSEALAWLSSKFTGILDGLKNKLEQTGDWFARLRDRVTGNSYIPDMVTEIGAEMDKLPMVMVDKAKKATEKTAGHFKKMQSDVSELMNRLFPEMQELKDFQRDMAILERARAKGQISSNTFNEASTRLRGLEDEPLGIKEEGAEPLDIPMPDLENFTDKLDRHLLVPVKETTAEIVESFSWMAQGVVGSIQDMVASFKSGDILGGLQGILSLITQVVDLLKLTGLIKPAIGGARAAGGPVSANKAYLVGERGPEWFTPGRSGFIHPNGSGAEAKPVKLVVAPSPYFDVVVDQRAAGVAAPMALAARDGGAAGGYQAVVQRQRKSIP